MSNKIIMPAVLFLIAVSAGIIFLATRPNPTDTSSPTVTKASDQVTETADINTRQTGVYQEYSEANFTMTEGDRILFFHAPWCSQCRSIEAGIKQQGVPDGVAIFKVDYDSNQGLRQKYGVTLQTTFVKVDSNGDFLDKYTAYDEPTFDAVKRDFL